MTKGTIVRWLVKEGDAVKAGDGLFEVETDKSMVDEAVLAKILAPEGSADLDIGAPIAIMVDNVSDVAAFKSY
jgi:pyruvate dehydrogenase E2 component (dihydrolipoamide acetyltransferase)